MPKKREKPFSETAYAKNKLKWEKDKAFDYISATRKDVEDYYAGDSYIKDDNAVISLLDRLAEIDYDIKDKSKFIFTVLTGVIVGLAFWIVKLLADTGESMRATELSSGSSDSIIVVLMGIVTEGGLIAFAGGVIFGVFALGYYAIKNERSNHNYLYVLPFERYIILEKLKTEHDFLVEDFGK